MGRARRRAPRTSRPVRRRARRAASRSWSPWRSTSAVRRATSGPVTATSGPTTSGARDDGGLCVFDFDNAGLADPSRSSPLVLVEYGAAIRGGRGSSAPPMRRRADRGASRTRRTSRCRSRSSRTSSSRAAGAGWRPTTDADRADNEGWVREFVDRPLTRTVIAGAPEPTRNLGHMSSAPRRRRGTAEKIVAVGHG